jgi:hypothetical protein
MSRLVDEFMRSSQHLDNQVDSLLQSKSIRGTGKSGDGESQVRMTFHVERGGDAEPNSDEILQFSLGDFGLLGACQLSILPELGFLSGGQRFKGPEVHLGQQQLSAFRRPEGQ